MDQEDLQDNPLFVAIRGLYPDLDSRASRDKWVICVPSFENLVNTRFSKKFMECHILEPSPFVTDEYISRTGIYVRFDGGQLEIIEDDPKQEGAKSVLSSTKILFEEFCFGEDESQYRLLCISHPMVPMDYPLVADRVIVRESFTQADWINLLCQSSENIPVLELMNSIIKISHFHSSPRARIRFPNALRHTFNDCYIFLDGEAGFNDFHTKFRQYIEEVFVLLREKNPKLKYYTHSSKLQFLIKRGIVACLQDGIYDRMIHIMDLIYSPLDAQFNYCLQKLIVVVVRSQRLPPQDDNFFSAESLCLKPQYYCPEYLDEAASRLQHLNQCRSTLSKLSLLLEVNQKIISGVEKAMLSLMKSHYKGEGAAAKRTIFLATDDMLPLFILIISIAKPQRLVSNVEYCRHFDCSEFAMTELGVMLATVHTAISFICDQAGQPLEDEFCDLSKRSVHILHHPNNTIKRSLEGGPYSYPTTKSNFVNSSESRINDSKGH